MLLLAAPAFCWCQLATGTIEIQVINGRQEPRPGVSVTVQGLPGSSIEVTSNARGECEVSVPYGAYRIAADDQSTDAYVAPLETTRVRLGPGEANVTGPRRPESYVGSPSLHGLLLVLEPAVVTDPLDFTGLASMRLPLISTRTYTWTDTRYALSGLNATDAWQPGRPALLPDLQAVSDVVVRGPEISLFLREPGRAWHGEFTSSNTGAPMAAEALQPSVGYNWFSRDNLQAGGPIGHRADVFFSGTGQWASEAVLSGPDLKSRILYANVRGRVQITDRDQMDAHFSGSQTHLSNWGVPAGLEALVGRRMSPEFNLPWGFAALEENDHLDSVQVGWTRQLAQGGRGGALQVRFGFSPMHLDTNTASGAPSQIELAGSVVTGSPPLTNLAMRTRHDFEAAFAPGALEVLGRRHRIAIGGGWGIAKSRNRFAAPGGMNLITANGAPAFLLKLNTPRDTHAGIRNTSAYLQDHIDVNSWFGIDAAIGVDFPRGSVRGRSDLIAWNSAAPRVGLVIAPPMLHRLVLRGSYAHLYEPLAGRYLDYGNPASLGGTEYQWLGGGQTGSLLLRFGGPYSSIDSHLRRPYADEFNLGAEVSLPWRTFASVRLFRRDEKQRIALIDTGVPPSAYRAVQILDPGPDAIPGTFDDQTLTVYAQDPATFGKDQYLLTNPGLRALHEGVVAEIGGGWQFLYAHASFMTVKAWGPANPGDSPLENDPGVIGALLADPNTAIHAAGRSYFDRAFVGKAQLSARLPHRFGGIEIANTANYLDGLVFARQLLVTGLPQGPMLVATTVRGSPEGGNRAEFAINWNLRVSRTVALARGSLRMGIEILNVTNAHNRLQESDISGPAFNQRLPVENEAPRFVRFDVGYRF